MKLERSLTQQTVSQHLQRTQYAVRGPVFERAHQIEAELRKGVPKTFSRVIRANVGDPQALGQKPVTFVRQVVGLAACPELLPNAPVPADVKQRVQRILDDCQNQSVGAYSPSLGLQCVRANAARYLSLRDGVPASADDVILGNGATDLMVSLLQLFVQDVDGKPPGVMIPVPQYPLFSAALASLNLWRVDYFLDEDDQWRLTRRALDTAWRSASGVNVRAIVVINPGNPTGQVMSREEMEEVLRFAAEHRLFVIADEVYQNNVFCKPFYSFKKVSTEMGSPYCRLELASAVTASKGWGAEAGLRGAMLELRGVDPGVRAVLATARAVGQCSNVLGQIALDCMLRPPVEGDPSFPLFYAQTQLLARRLRQRAHTARDALNDIPGYTCNEIDGAMFAFPRFELPPRALEEAHRRGVEPDQFYCLQLLEETGVCCVPGSGFGQAAGSCHYRLAVTFPSELLRDILRTIRHFHLHFLNRYTSD